MTIALGGMDPNDIRLDRYYLRYQSLTMVLSARSNN
ncbi:hypothetical protein CAURIC_00585 [Corynebacterium auriscanis]|nr:hypothetical protein CAURIC_00585 [Corynebacterium auriscanis]